MCGVFVGEYAGGGEVRPGFGFRVPGFETRHPKPDTRQSEILQALEDSDG